MRFPRVGIPGVCGLSLKDAWCGVLGAKVQDLGSVQ